MEIIPFESIKDENEALEQYMGNMGRISKEDAEFMLYIILRTRIAPKASHTRYKLMDRIKDVRKYSELDKLADNALVHLESFAH